MGNKAYKPFMNERFLFLLFFFLLYLEATVTNVVLGYESDILKILYLFWWTKLRRKTLVPIPQASDLIYLKQNKTVPKAVFKNKLISN